MPDFEVGFSYMQKQYGTIDKLPAEHIDDVDDKAFEYFKKVYIANEDEEDYSDFMVEEIMEVKNGH